MTAPPPGRLSGSEVEIAPAASDPGRTRSWLWLVLLLPGGLILAAGIGIAWAGLVLLLPGLRRMAASLEGLRVAATLPGPTAQPYGKQHEPSPRVWLGQGGTC